MGGGSVFGLISSSRQLQEQGDLSWGMTEIPEGQALACMSLELCVTHTQILCVTGRWVFDCSSKSLSCLISKSQ